MPCIVRIRRYFINLIERRLTLDLAKNPMDLPRS